jgi:uncharacterized protein YcaQ
VRQPGQPAWPAKTVPVELSPAQARRIALNAQRFGPRHPAGEAGPQHLRQLAADLGAVQIDAVNVLVRSHYLPFYARLGSYPVQLVDDLAYQRHELFEYWGHAASLLPVELHPALRWRMDAYAAGREWSGVRDRLERERPGYLAAVLREITERGPLAYTELADPARRERVPTRYAESSLAWYRWSDGKTALEGLFLAGRLAVAGRRGFERRYDLPERVIPAEILARPAIPVDEAQRALVLTSARALGVATQRDLYDYFRLPAAATRARLRELVDAGALLPAQVQGWPERAFLLPGASDGTVSARALLSPFDSLIWERARTERLFGYRHVFELYVSAAKRQYGYYVLPFLLGESIVARTDLKADRASGTLRVLGCFLEDGAPSAEVAAALAAELRELAGWLGLGSVDVADHGGLARPLRRALR